MPTWFFSNILQSVARDMQAVLQFYFTFARARKSEQVVCSMRQTVLRKCKRAYVKDSKNSIVNSNQSLKCK